MSAIVPGRVPAVAASQAVAATTDCRVASIWSTRRVCLLIVAMILMGLADLYLTLSYMSSVGMVELNPIARAMVRIGDGRQLILYKLFTIALSCGALYLGRRHRLAERAAWSCTIVLLLVMAHWVNYNASIAELTNEIIALQQSPGEVTNWVVLGGGAID